MTRSLPSALRLIAACLPLAALMATTTRAEDEGPQVQVTADRPHLSADQVVRVTYTFTGNGLSQIRPPASLQTKNLRLLRGPDMSTRVEMINFDVKKSVSFTYTLRPIGVGQAEIAESQWLATGDKPVKAAGYVMEVSVGTPRTGGRDARDGDGEPEPDPWTGMINPRQRAAEPRQDAILEFTATPDRTSAYLGEEIAIHYELITQVDVTGLEYVEPPKFPGCWAEDIEKPEKPNGKRDVYQSRSVMRFTLLKKAVSGLAPGAITIPAAKVRLAVRGMGDPFSDPFNWMGMRPQVVERSTKPITIHILPIPGKPGFQGPVGKFDLTARIDRARVAVGEAVTLKVRLAGNGNLRTTSGAPTVNVSNARLYPPTLKTEPARAGTRNGVAAEWSYLVVPSAPGQIEIPPVSLEVFDPSEKRMVSKKTAPIALVVDPNPDAKDVKAATAAHDVVTPAIPGTPASETAAVTEMPSAAPAQAPAALRPDRKGSPASSPGSLDLRRGTVAVPLWLLAALPITFVVAFGGVAIARRTKAARAVFRGALDPEPGETKERAAARIERALREWLYKRHGIPEGAAAASIVESLISAGAAPDLIGELRALLEELEFLRFAPQLGEYGAKISETRQRAARLFTRMR